MVYNREEAAKRAEAALTNVPGTCQAWTRTMFGAPSVGDVDGDGDADAVDGWNSEPVSARRSNRNPPRGVPVAWSGGRNGYGHRAVSLGNGKIRSTDAGGRGKIATVDLGWVEREWGLTYLGWSTTISGIDIPVPPSHRKRYPPRIRRASAEIKTEIERVKLAREVARKRGENLAPYREMLQALRAARRAARKVPKR